MIIQPTKSFYMEKSNNNNELVIMRSQMASFKKQLEQQEIINGRIMAESMKKKFSWIKKMIIGEIILIPIFLYLAFAAKYNFNMSWWSIDTFIILLLCDIWCDYDINMLYYFVIGLLHLAVNPPRNCYSYYTAHDTAVEHTPHACVGIYRHEVQAYFY